MENLYNFRFGGVRGTFDKYTLGKDDNGNLVAVERKTGTMHTDELIIDRVKFSIAWVKATMNSHPRTSPNGLNVTNQDYEYAFDENARKTYATIMACINYQLLTTGDIDPLEVIEDAGTLNYKYASEYARQLFSQKKFAEATDTWARRAIPNALPKTHPTLTEQEARLKNYQEDNMSLK